MRNISTYKNNNNKPNNKNTKIFTIKTDSYHVLKTKIFKQKLENKLCRRKEQLLDFIAKLIDYENLNIIGLENLKGIKQGKIKRKNQKTKLKQENNNLNNTQDIISDIEQMTNSEVDNNIKNKINNKELNTNNENNNLFVFNSYNSMGLWKSSHLSNRIEMHALRHSVIFKQFNPRYTSLKCPSCGNTHASNRSKEFPEVFSCTAYNCKSEGHADFIAANNGKLKLFLDFLSHDLLGTV